MQAQPSPRPSPCGTSGCPGGAGPAVVQGAHPGLRLQPCWLPLSPGDVEEPGVRWPLCSGTDAVPATSASVTVLLYLFIHEAVQLYGSRDCLIIGRNRHYFFYLRPLLDHSSRLVEMILFAAVADGGSS